MCAAVRYTNGYVYRNNVPLYLGLWKNHRPEYLLDFPQDIFRQVISARIVCSFF